MGTARGLQNPKNRNTGERINLDNPETITFGSLFSGIGGLDLGLEQAKMQCVFQVENDRHCLTILNKHWPDVPKNEVRPCMGLVGGDPCPIRSHPNKIHGTRVPDMSGYFLAMVTRCKPRWILRENVPAVDAVEFVASLELLGYRSFITWMDSKAFTGQSRPREFVAGFDCKKRAERFMVLVKRACNERPGKKTAQEESPLTCLTTRSKRRNSVDETYVCEKRNRLRHLSHTERESLQGLPAGWTDGIPNSARERAVGNAVTVPVAKWLGELIVEALVNSKFMPQVS
jgi:DNA (cytosine-5)-methyltransferase 1